MSTFLELCKGVARESGTEESTSLSTVEGAARRLEKIVHWTRQAWVRIQNDRADWLFLRGEFCFDLIAGTARYTPASVNISDLAKWVTAADENGACPITIYDQDIGPADEGELATTSWNVWRRTFDRGVQVHNRPVSTAVSPGNELLFGPVPDRNYKARGEYQRTPQVLMSDKDVPLCPARFHDIIQWKALMLLQEHDENQLNIGTALGNYADILGDLERDQLPAISTAGPLA